MAWRINLGYPAMATKKRWKQLEFHVFLNIILPLKIMENGDECDDQPEN